MEEDVHLGLAVAERADVLSHGKHVLAASAADLREDMSLGQASYLGVADPIPTTETERS